MPPLALQQQPPVLPRPAVLSVLSDDEFSQPSCQPPPSEHLYTRLGLLLGQRGQPGSGGSQGSFASISSLENSDVNMAGSTNTSPISTLTGEGGSSWRGGTGLRSSPSMLSAQPTS